MKILFIGDVVGRGGRDAIISCVPDLLRQHECGFCVVNAENVAGGNGMTRKCLGEMSQCGIDVFTSGDHVWDQKEFPGEIGGMSNVLRAANFSPEQPGRGYGVFTTVGGQKVGVLNLIGRTFIGCQSDNPFVAAEKAVEELRKETPIILVDFHAEATSEKIAMGRFLDGKVSAVLGTHTHVPTADAQIFPGGTAYQTDVGMVGARESILGRDIAPILSRFYNGMPVRFTVTETGIRLCGAVVTVNDADGKATAIAPIHVDVD